MPSQKSNSPANPFDHAFEMLGKVPEVVTDEVNAEALEKLTQALTTRASDRGRMILLRSPRAGFGKTHLLMRLHERVAHSHEFIPLEPLKGKELGAHSVLDAVLRRFSRILPAGGGLTVLDLLARRILASGLEPLVKSGEVPSQDRDTALQALQTRPVETFDFHNEDAVTAQWAMANFALLGPRLTAELAERTHAGFRPVAWWVELLFRYSSAPVDQSTRNSSLFETVFSSDSMETDVHEKLVTLLNLTGLVTSPVLVLDEVEGFSSNPEAALQAATYLNALHQSCESLALIISVNGDVWETAFLPRIPCGLKDRLSDIVIDLEPMEKETALQMLRDRAGEKAEQIADELDFESGVVYARGLIRCAADAWSDVSNDDAGEEDVEQGEPISLVPQEAAPLPEPEIHQDPVEEERPAVVADPPSVVIPTVQEEPPLQADLVEPEEQIDAPLSQVEQDPMEPSDGYQAVGVIDQDLAEPTPREPAAEQAEQPLEQLELDPQPEQRMPDLSNLPQPFAQQQSQTEPVSEQQEVQRSEQGAHQEQPAQSGIPQPAAPSEPATEPLQVAPQTVVNSPFSIDTSVPAQSPFQPAQPDEQPQQPVQQNPEPPVASPFEPVEPIQPQQQPAEPPVNNPPQPSPQEQQPAIPQPQPHSVTDKDHEKVEDLLRQFRDRYGRD